MKEVGPTGHFFGTSHTLERYETAFYAPFLSHWNNFETREERGSVTTPERANKIPDRLLISHRLADRRRPAVRARRDKTTMIRPVRITDRNHAPLLSAIYH
ncbi:MAG: trimethylamine methyltransferase family protein [Gammaproteobacteria bacterium]|nr:trimethylamine methyltransferase family protein [Gammaproteobacteria bacterium]